ncbi:MAG: DUF429 domain-containing protein [Pseudomonadota bacterium]
MPATYGGNKAGAFVLGVDGCRAGWVCVRLNVPDMTTAAFLAPSFAALLAGAGAEAAMIIVDMPIGLAETGRRACEREARKRLSPLRHSSVFSTPRRPMLAFGAYEEANDWGKRQGEEAGGGLSKQAWMITPKIREIDDAIAPADQTRLAEGHPEIAFWRLNGEQPCRHSKRASEGAQERLALLKQHGIAAAEKHYEDLRRENGAGIGRDDVYDACALALTAKARLDGSAIHLTDGRKDARGLVMEIWG